MYLVWEDNALDIFGDMLYFQKLWGSITHVVPSFNRNKSDSNLESPVIS